MVSRVQVVAAAREHLPAWGRMRFALWPWDTPELHAEEAATLYLVGHPDRAAFVALDDDDAPVGFVEAALRRDYVEGCETSPVAFLEGIFVAAEARGRGAGRALAEAVAAWGRGCGCSEFASNALIDNAESHAFHAAIGFVETERVVYFRRPL